MLERWIGQRLRLKGGRIERPALQDLATFPVTDFRQLDLTLDRLVVYADGQPITRSDVRTLVTQSHEATVFELVDAVGLRDRRAALEAYRRLLADEVSPIYLLVMLTRQLRLLLLAKEALERREDIGAALKVHHFVAQKLSQQARNFSFERCVGAFQRLAATDEAIKTGQADEDVAVELLLVELTER
jgi:DNA polymerase-3 subunit delta